MIPDPRPYASMHAALRAQQRLRRVVTRTEWMAAVLLITERDARLVQTHPGGAETWAVRLGRDLVEVIWNPWQGTIVTLATLPMPWQCRPPRDRRDWRHGDPA